MTSLKRIALAVAIGAAALFIFALTISWAQPALVTTTDLVVTEVGLPAPVLEAWPILGLLLASALVLLAAEIVKSAVQWLKVRLEHRLMDVPHWIIHAMNLVISAGVGLLFVMEGRLDTDAFFAGIPWPWNWFIFTAAVFWRAGGKRDEEIESARVLAAGVRR